MIENGTVFLKNLDFGNEAGDDVDPDELLGYFVEQEAFGKFLEKRKRLLVATARKGIGKSCSPKMDGCQGQREGSRCNSDYGQGR